jgi:hypothetical protein
MDFGDDELNKLFSKSFCSTWLTAIAAGVDIVCCVCRLSSIVRAKCLVLIFSNWDNLLSIVFWNE